MTTESNGILYEEGVFPLRVETLCEMIGTPCSLHGVLPTTELHAISATDNGRPEPGSLYLPYEAPDDQLRWAVSQGAAAVLTDHIVEGLPCIVVEDVLDAICRFSARLYEKIGLPAVTVSGSEGKTTTKRMVYSVLRQEKKAFCKLGNYNSLHALCCLLPKLTRGTQVVIHEVDESREFNTLHCSKVLHPDIALVTNIAESHIGLFRGITAGLKEDGVVILNADDADSMAAGFDAPVLTVGIHSENADCRAVNLRTTPGGTEFDLLYRDERVHVTLPVFGEHNVYNAMMAYLVGVRMGVSREGILRGLAEFRNKGIRQNVCSFCGTLVYADCYNASPTSIHYALKCFDDLCAARRGRSVAVLGDIAEVEGFEEETYRRIAESVQNAGFDVLVTCGKDSDRIARGVSRTLEVHHTRDLNELNGCLRKLRRQGCSAFLFKASRIMKLENSIKKVFPLQFYKMRYDGRRFR